MKTRFLILSAICAFVALQSESAAAKDGVSGWAQEPYARVRLISAGQADDGTWRAGLEIDMDKGWKTYWRVPGQSGVPPVFDWSKSRNVADVSVNWPVPVRFLDSGLESIGYKKDVILPLTVKSAVPGRAPHLVMNLTYAVCSDICVPQFADLTLDMSQTAPFRLKLAVDNAASDVPRRAEDESLVAIGDGDISREEPLILHIAGQGDAAPLDVFVTGPDDWYLPKPAALEPAGGKARYAVSLDAVPEKAEIDGAELLVTVVYADKAVEQLISLSR